MNVFKELLGDAYGGLPAAVRRFHDGEASYYRGSARSGGATNLLIRGIRGLFGFPETAAQMDVEIWLERTDEGDRWRRRFGARRFQSSFRVAPDGCLDERFWPFGFGFRLRAEGGRMYWDFERWSLLGVPLPKWLGPRIETWETQGEQGGFEFYSHADFPLIGRLVHYHGVVHPADGAAPEN
jgi:hypothetical protein